MLIEIKDLFDELLLEAKSPEEIKRIIMYKNPNIPEGFIDAVMDIDPTKKKSYTVWVLSKIGDEGELIDKVLRNGQLKRLFEYVKENNDVQLQMFDSVKDALDLLPEEDSIFRKEEDEDYNDFDIVYDDAVWRIAEPHTYEADKKLGENTRWCTAGYYDDSGRYWRDYTKDGRLFVNFDKRRGEKLEGKEYPYKRYQFSFEHKQFMDAKDDPVTVGDLDMPEGAFKYYEDEGYDVEKLSMSREEQYEYYCEQRWDDSVTVTQYHGDDYLSLMRESNEDYEWNEDEEDPDYYLYNDSQDSWDPIFYAAFKKEDSIIWSGEDNGLAIMKPNYAEDYCVVSYVENNGSRRGGGYELIDNVEKYTLIGENMIICISKESRRQDDNLRSLYVVDGDGNKSDVYVAYHYIDNFEIFASPLNDNDMAKEWAKGGFFFETSDDGVHSLYVVSSDSGIEELIKRDVPINGKAFVVDEDGSIHGKLRDYNFDTFFDDDNHSYQINYYVCDKEFYVAENGAKKNAYNIFSSEDNRRIFENDFVEIKQSKSNIIPISFELCKWTVVDLHKNGERICGFYNDVKKIDSNNDYLYMGITGDDEAFTYIDGLRGREYGPFKKILAKPSNGRIPVIDSTSGFFRIFNTNNGKMELEWATRYHLYFYCSKPVVLVSDNNNNIYLVDYSTTEVIEKNIALKDVGSLRYADDVFKDCVLLAYTDGTVNLFNTVLRKRMLPDCMESVRNTYRTPKGYLHFVRGDNKNVVIYDGANNKCLPTINGISEDKKVAHVDFAYDLPIVTFTVNDYQGTPCRIQYNYKENTISWSENIWPIRYYSIDSANDEIKAKANELIFAQKPQIAQAFSEMYRRMLNAGKINE